MAINSPEQERLQIQARLDAAKTQLERNQLGQFATPSELALEIVRYADSLLAAGPIRFLEPAIGTGAFYSALLHHLPPGRLATAVGYEVDPHYGLPAKDLWAATPLELRLASFTAATAPDSDAQRFNLILANPPYVRHHHLPATEKLRLQEKSESATGIRLGGLSGLYCHFITLGHGWMQGGAVAAWLIPSEFMDVNYGQALKRYLLDNVTLLRIHRFDPEDVQFGDALVSSAVVWLRNAPPPSGHAVEFTAGGTHAAPKLRKIVTAAALRQESKWTRFPLSAERPTATDRTLADFFFIKRGIATGDNRFFVLSEPEAIERDLPKKYLRPILPSPRYLKTDRVDADDKGIPLIDQRLVLIDCDIPEAQLAKAEPALWRYLQAGKERVAAGYLCRQRSPWYAQERRPAPPILCTYMGRGDPSLRRPFRFILNRSNATAANVYLLLYPKPLLAVAMQRSPDLLEQTWRWLNRIDIGVLLGEGRVYGGGLYKLEPKELANVPAAWLAEAVSSLSPASPAELVCT